MKTLHKITSFNSVDHTVVGGSMGRTLCKVNLGRIHEDFARITSDSVDPGGRGSIDSQLGKDPQRLCKDYLRQC